MCEKTKRDKRRYEKAQAKYDRWCHDPKWQASTANAYEDMSTLYSELTSPVDEKNRRCRMVGGREPSCTIVVPIDGPRVAIGLNYSLGSNGLLR